ncbi:hypothetical protein Q427_13790 [Halomonas sp. BC04]|nr:hypothetical protein Q427_13790 [Halomonas sp. BC04]
MADEILGKASGSVHRRRAKEALELVDRHLVGNTRVRRPMAQIEHEATLVQRREQLRSRLGRVVLLSCQDKAGGTEQDGALGLL